ncbi:MAG: hypothetical protein ABSF80_08575 [Chitinispirillaceae bacterium]|jgi:hypothetical protein
MKPEICRSLFLLLLVSPHFISAEFNLNVEPKFGFKTNVPRSYESYNASSQQSPDSLYGDFAFTSLTLEQSWISGDNRDWTRNLSFSGEANRYFGGPDEISLAPDFSVTRESIKQATTFGGGIAYYSFATGYDPTKPEKYAEFSIHFDKKYNRGNPIAFACNLSLLKDVSSPRIDIKSDVRLKCSWKLSSRLTFFVKPGIILDLSNGETSGFLQPLLVTGATYRFDKRDLVLAQIYTSYPFYGSGDILTFKKNRGKDLNATSSPVVSQQRIPQLMAFASYSRELTGSLDLYLNYDFTVLDPGLPRPIYSSHAISISIGWNLK